MVERNLTALAELFGFELHGPSEGVTLVGVTLDSAIASPGELFAALPGRVTHGARFAASAKSFGAVAVLTDSEGLNEAKATGLPVLVTDDVRAVLGFVSAWVYRTGIYAAQNSVEGLEIPGVSKRSTTFGVTGTNGKTSVTYILNALLGQLGTKTAMASTITRQIGKRTESSGLTTPEAPDVHEFLSLARDAECTAVVVETSAQALSRHRVDGIVFDVVGFTNLSHDHLNDYADFDEYFDAKALLFNPEHACRAVVTVDEAYGAKLAAKTTLPVTTLSSEHVGFSANADWAVSITSRTVTNTGFTLTGPKGERLETRISLFGDYMASNAALAILMVLEANSILGYTFEDIAKVLERDGGINVFVPGRAELLSGEKGPRVFLDYAHTPDAFDVALASLRPITEGSLITLMGVEGDRDTSKLKAMGALSARASDVVIVYDFHPRSSDLTPLRAEVIAGARDAVSVLGTKNVDIRESPEPIDAVNLALSLAKEGDTVFIGHFGHENYREVDGVKQPFSIREIVRTALIKAGWPVPDGRTVEASK